MKRIITIIPRYRNGTHSDVQPCRVLKDRRVQILQTD